MIELAEEKIDEGTIRIRKVNWKYFTKEELEAMKTRMQEELTKVINLLENFK